MKGLLSLFILLLLGSCVQSGYQPAYIISDHTEETVQQSSSKEAR